MARHVVHFEIPADDLARAQEFYSGAFGWVIEPLPQLNYAMLQTTETSTDGMPLEPGAINGGMFRREEPLTSPVITVDVENIDEALATITSLGGTTVLPKQTVEGMGFTAYFKDSEGNLMGLWQNL